VGAAPRGATGWKPVLRLGGIAPISTAEDILRIPFIQPERSIDWFDWILRHFYQAQGRLPACRAAPRSLFNTPETAKLAVLRAGLGYGSSSKQFCVGASSRGRL
jgi:hypothetical protein